MITLVEQWKNEGYTKNNFGNECNDILGYYEDGRPIMNYSCVLCTSPNCFKSEGWKIPEKDKVTYDKCQELEIIVNEQKVLNDKVVETFGKKDTIVIYINKNAK